MRTTNILLDLKPTFNNCIPTFEPPCIIMNSLSANLSMAKEPTTIYLATNIKIPSDKLSRLGSKYCVIIVAAK